MKKIAYMMAWAAAFFNGPVFGPMIGRAEKVPAAPEGSVLIQNIDDMHITKLHKGDFVPLRIVGGHYNGGIYPAQVKKSYNRKTGILILHTTPWGDCAIQFDMPANSTIFVDKEFKYENAFTGFGRASGSGRLR